MLHALNWPFWVEALVAFIILDFAVWLQHFAMHRFPFLWRMHAVHHSDRDLDVTTALRFHPFELVVSTFYKSAIVALLGVPLVVALAFELWLNANALFNHSNIRLPKKLDRMLRMFFVTPDMHLVHHSVIVAEQKSNFGFALSIWDRLFSTYRAESHVGADNQKIGLSQFEDQRPSAFVWSMKQPLT
jgi:sterol desaturase/sphingolipid hydroxylase (fatty acid hydroxylase superfamily)